MGPIGESGRQGAGSSRDLAGGQPHPGQVLSEPPARRRVVVVVVDGSPDSGAALRQAASQARQRNALLDIVHVMPAGTDGAASLLARVKLGEFARRECPYGTGTPVRFRVECGDPRVVLGLAAAGAELLINGMPRPPLPDGEPAAAPSVPAAPRLRRWVHALIPEPGV
jgi:hypothetical protein